MDEKTVSQPGPEQYREPSSQRDGEPFRLEPLTQDQQDYLNKLSDGAGQYDGTAVIGGCKNRKS